MKKATFLEITKDLSVSRIENLLLLNKDKRSGIYNLKSLSPTSCEFWYKGLVITAATQGTAMEEVDRVKFTYLGKDFGNQIIAYQAAIVQLYMFLKAI